MTRREQLVEVFEDTQRFYAENPILAEAVRNSCDHTKFYDVNDYPVLSKEAESDNVRVYVPIDINREAILRRLYDVIWHYEKATEKNEFAFSADVEAIVFQIEIYDQAWQTVHKLKNDEHSVEAISLVRDFVNALKEIPDGCAELFPFEMIDELENEYLEVM